MKILVVDDHPLFRVALCLVLRGLDEGIAVLEAPGCDVALDLIERNRDLELVLLDLQLPDSRGLSTLEKLRCRYPEMPVAVVAATEEPGKVRAAMRLGAIGFIPKSSSAVVLSNALRLILSGGVYLPPTLLAAETGEAAACAATGGMPPVDRDPIGDPVSDLGLTLRQLQVLRPLAAGASNKAIARELNLAENTVKAHVASILRVLRVDTRTQVIAVLARRRITFEENDQQGSYSL